MMFFQQYNSAGLPGLPGLCLAFLLVLSHCGLKWGEPSPSPSPYRQPSVGGVCEKLDYKTAFVSYFAPGNSSANAGESLSQALNCLSKITNESQAFFANESLNRGELIQLLQQDFVKTKATSPIVDHILSSEYNYLDHYIEIKDSLINMIQAGSEGRALAEGAVCPAGGSDPSGTVFSKEEARVFADFLENLAVFAPRIEEEAQHLLDRLREGTGASHPLILNGESLRQKLLPELLALFKSDHPLSARFFEKSFSPLSSSPAGWGNERERLFRSLSRMADLSSPSSNRLDRQGIKYILLNIYITSALFPLYDRDGDGALSSEELRPLTCWTEQVVSLIVSPRLRDLPYVFHGLMSPQLISDYVLRHQKLPFLEDGSVNWDYVSFSLTVRPIDDKSLSYAGMSDLISSLFVTGFFFRKNGSGLENLSSGSGLLAMLSKWLPSPRNRGGDSPVLAGETAFSTAETAAVGAQDSSGGAAVGERNSSIDGASSNTGELSGPAEQASLDFDFTAESFQNLWQKENSPPLSLSTAERIISLKDILFYILEQTQAGRDLSGLCGPGPLPAPSSNHAELSFRSVKALVGFLAKVQESGTGFFESFLADPEVQALFGPSSQAGPAPAFQELWDSPAFKRLFVLKLSLWFEERFPGYSLFLRNNLQALSRVERASVDEGMAQTVEGAAAQASFEDQFMDSLWMAVGDSPSSLAEFKSSRNRNLIFLHIHMIKLVFSLYDRDGDFSLSPEESEALACLPARILEISTEPFLRAYSKPVRDFFAPLAVSRYFTAHQRIPFWDGREFPAFTRQDLRFVGWRLLEGGALEGHLSYGEVSRQIAELWSLGFYIRQWVSLPGLQQADSNGEAFLSAGGIRSLEGLPRFYHWLIGLFKADPGEDPETAASSGSTIGAGVSALTKQDVEEFANFVDLELPEDIEPYLLIARDILQTAELYRSGWPVPIESVCNGLGADYIAGGESLPPDFELFSAEHSLTLKQILENQGHIASKAEQDSRLLFSLLQEEEWHEDSLSKQELGDGSGRFSANFVQILVRHFERDFPEQARFWKETLTNPLENPTASFFESAPAGGMPSLSGSPGLTAPQPDGGVSQFGPPDFQTGSSAFMDEPSYPDSQSLELSGGALARTALSPRQEKARVLWGLVRRPFKGHDRLSAQNIRSFVLNLYTAQALFDAWDENGDLRLSSEELRPLACLARRSLELALRPLLTEYPLLKNLHLPQALTAYLLRHQNIPPGFDLSSLDFNRSNLLSPQGIGFIRWFVRESERDRAWLFDPQKAENFSPSSDPFAQILPQPVTGSLAPVSQDPFRLSAGELSVLTALIYTVAYDSLQDLLYSKAAIGSAAAAKAQPEQEDYSLSDSLSGRLRQWLSWESPLSYDELLAWLRGLKQAFAHSDSAVVSSPPLDKNSPSGGLFIPCFDPDCLAAQEQESEFGPPPDSFLYPPQR